MAFAIALVTLLLIVIVQVSMPYFVKRTIVFGVSIPEQFLKEDRLKSYKRKYVLVSLLVSFIIIATFIFWTISKEPSEERLIVTSTILQFVIILVCFVLYFTFHKKTKVYKNNMGWTQELKEVTVADLTIRSEENMAPWYIYLFPIIVVVGLAVYTFFQYDRLPNEIPTHWGANGKADAFSEKSPFKVMQLLMILFIMQMMFLAFHIAMKHSGIKLSATNLNASKKRQLTLRGYTSWFLLYTTVVITILFAVLHLQMIHQDLFPNYVLTFLPLGLMFAVLVGTIVLLVKVGLSDKDSDVLVSEPIMDQDEDQYWKGGLFYFNKKDPSIFVEQRFGVGFTINLANPKAYLLLLAPIILIIIIAFL